MVLAEPVDAVTALMLEAIRSTPSVASEIYERVNELAGEDTVDQMAAAAGAEARGVVLGLRADTVSGDVPSTAEMTTLLCSTEDARDVDWSAIGEAILIEVVSGSLP